MNKGWESTTVTGHFGFYIPWPKSEISYLFIHFFQAWKVELEILYLFIFSDQNFILTYIENIFQSLQTAKIY